MTRRPLHGDRPRVGQLPIDEDVRRELDAHIRLAAEELEEAGWEPREAIREAERRFGDMSELTRECREITRAGDRAEIRAGRVDALRQDLKYGVRMLRTSPGFTVLATLTLALGIGANTALFSLVYGVLLKPLPYEDSERIVWVREHQPDRGRTMPVAMANFLDWNEARSFESMAAYGAWSQTVRGGERPYRSVTAQVTQQFASVLRVAPHAGRFFGPGDYGAGAEPVALIGEDLWEREYGRAPLDQIRLDVSGAARRVVGVLPSGFDFPFASGVWIPVTDENTSRSAHNYSVIGRLADGVTIAQADAELDAIQRRVTAEALGEDDEFIAEAVTVLPLREQVSSGSSRSLGLLFGAAGLVLLIGCANLASTLLARGATRSRELSVRQAMGAGRWRLVRQLLTESGLLAGAGALVGLAFAQLLLMALKQAEGVAIPRLDEVTIDAGALIFTLVACVATGVLFGLFPAVRLSRAEPGQALRSEDRSQGGGGRGKVWGPLVGAEVALAFILLAGSLLLVRSFQRVLDTDRGFAVDGVLTADIDLDPVRYADSESQIQFYQRLLSDLEGRRKVDAAGIVTSVPLSGGLPDGRLELDGDLSKHATAGYAVASGGYFRAMGIPLLQGRTFDQRDGQESGHVAIVSQSFADRYWPGESAIGRQLTGGGMDEFWEERPFATVIGVVADARYVSLAREPGPLAYFPFSQRPRRLQTAATIVVRSGTGNAAGLAEPLREALRANDPSIPPRFQTMEERLRGSLSQRRFTMALIGAFAVVALVLAGIGIYGVVSFGVARRTREMGIRLALGGERSQLRRMVQLQSMRSVFAGALAGLVGALVAGRLLETVLFGVEPSDPATLAMTAFVLLTVAWCAALIPAVRSTRVDPMVAMRSD